MDLYVFTNTYSKVKVPTQKQPYLGSWWSQRPEIFTVTSYGKEVSTLKFLRPYVAKIFTPGMVCIVM